jgi:hypothetical protein
VLTQDAVKASEDEIKMLVKPATIIFYCQIASQLPVVHLIVSHNGGKYTAKQKTLQCEDYWRNIRWRLQILNKNVGCR